MSVLFLCSLYITLCVYNFNTIDRFVSCLNYILYNVCICNFEKYFITVYPAFKYLEYKKYKEELNKSLSNKQIY